MNTDPLSFHGEALFEAVLNTVSDAITDEIEQTQLMNLYIIWRIMDALRSWAFADVENRLHTRVGGDR